MSILLGIIIFLQLIIILSVIFIAAVSVYSFVYLHGVIFKLLNPEEFDEFMKSDDVKKHLEEKYSKFTDQELLKKYRIQSKLLDISMEHLFDKKA